MLPAQASKAAASHTKTAAVPVQKEAGELPRWDLCSGGTAPTASASWILMPQTLDTPALWGLGVWATANHSAALRACHKASSHGRGSSSISISISTGQDAKYVLWELWCEDAVEISVNSKTLPIRKRSNSPIQASHGAVNLVRLPFTLALKERYHVQENERDKELELPAGYVGAGISCVRIELKKESAFNICLLRPTTHSPLFRVQP
ncbi:hypothetical protein B0H14DRAFT_2621658 [Mycena olivaceomarginata]|nr:hypothetical protein B0H14DRAFT_2621658 [Mycena olivaceomarginata]